MMSEALADEVAPFGIEVTAVAPSGVRTDFLDDNTSMKHPNKQLPEYETVVQTMRGLAQSNHHQSGDPKLVAQAILTLVQLEHMPKRLYLGQSAIGAMQSHINELITQINDNIELSMSIDR